MITQLRPQLPRRRLARAVRFAGAALALSGGAFLLASGTSFAAGVGPGSTVNVSNLPYSSAGQSCDPTRDGWHFIVNQLEYPVGSVIDNNDFGQLMITFSDGSTAVGFFTDLSGGQTAHFLSNDPAHQTGNFTVTSVTMTFPAGTDITGYGNFVLSHPPCGTVTTVAPTTTTTLVAPTTTTQAPTTTTTKSLAPTTTTTARGLSEAPATTTTTHAGLLSEAPGSAAAVFPTARRLPTTGTESGQLALFGVAIFALGVTLLGVARRYGPVDS